VNQYLIVGIDPGVKTGLAIWNRATKKLEDVETTTITAAMTRIAAMHRLEILHSVVFEDARMRTGYFGKNAKAKKQGAGSIKRDCSIWAEFLGGLVGVPFLAISPRDKGAKVGAEQFVKLTGWPKRTSEHGRDAAMLVIGR
jgi:hypothetical protein